MNIETLVERLSASTSADKRLAIEINEHFEIASYITDDGDPTASLDAAIALAELLLPGHGRMGAKGRCTENEPRYAYQIFETDLHPTPEQMSPIGEGEHDLEPLALVIATLRAIQSKKGAA